MSGALAPTRTPADYALHFLRPTAAIGLSLLLWHVSCGRTGLPAYLPLLYPLIILLTDAIAARSLLLSLAGRAVCMSRRLERMA